MTTNRPAVAREAAYLAVRDALAGKGFVSKTLGSLRHANALGGRDAPLAMDIALGAVRHVVTIEHVLSAVARFERERVSDDLRAILYIAAYQVIWMDRIPLFAAVDEAVEQAHTRVGGRAPAMANAILRRLARAVAQRRAPWQRLSPRHVRVSWDEACVFAQDVLPPAERGNDHLAAATGERRARYRRLVQRFGRDGAEQIAWANQAVPVTVLQRNALRRSSDEFQRDCRAVFGDECELTPDAAFLPGATRFVEAPVFAAGSAYVQDPTAHAAALLVGAQPGERVLDRCAAPGGKSLVVAIQMQDRGEIVACDVSPERLARVRENVARLGLSCVRSAEASAPPDRAPFDAALLDVPCTNTGVIARRPEARLRLTTAKLAALVRVQRELLVEAAEHVRPGGRLVYSTCSLELGENERQIEAFLSSHADWSLDCQQTTLPAWGPRLCDWHDGGYAARLLRK